MRTTITLDDDAARTAREFAASRNLSLSRAISEIIRRHSAQRLVTTVVDGLHLPVLPQDSPVVTLERVLELEDE